MEHESQEMQKIIDNETKSLTDRLISEGAGSVFFQALSDSHERNLNDRNPQTRIAIDVMISDKKGRILGYRTQLKEAEKLEDSMGRELGFSARQRIVVVEKALNDADAHFIEQQQNSSQQ